MSAGGGSREGERWKLPCNNLPWSLRHAALLAPQAGEPSVERDARRVGQYEDGAEVDSAQDLAHRLLTTVYMGTVNSSAETCSRAAELAAQVHPCQ